MKKYETIICDTPRITAVKLETDDISDYSLEIKYDKDDIQEIDIPESVYSRMVKYMNNVS